MAMLALMNAGSKGRKRPKSRARGKKKAKGKAKGKKR